jgi:hypothetical protein
MDQATEQSDLTTDEAANALMDYLEAEDSVEEEPEATEEPETESDDVEQDDDTEQDDEVDEEVEEDEPEPEEEDQEDDVPETYIVTIDGQDVEVNRDELLSGYQRQADYTRKTQEVAEQRKQFEQEKQQVQQQRDVYFQQLDATLNHLNQMVTQDQNIDWTRLREEDPMQYMLMRDQANERQQALQQADQHRQYMLQTQQQEQQEQQSKYLQEQRDKLLTVWPEWRDPSKAQANKQAISNFLLDNGFSNDEISGLADFRTLQIVEKARKYDELQKSKPAIRKKVKSAPKVQKPQAQRTKSQLQGEARKKQINRLKQTGAVNDAAALLMDYV